MMCNKVMYVPLVGLGAFIAFACVYIPYLAIVDNLYAPSSKDAMTYTSIPLRFAWEFMWVPPGTQLWCDDSAHTMRDGGLLYPLAAEAYRFTALFFHQYTSSPDVSYLQSTSTLGKDFIVATVLWLLLLFVTAVYMGGGFVVMGGSITALAFVMDICSFGIGGLILFVHHVLVPCVGVVLEHQKTAALACVLAVAMVGAARRM